MAEHGKDSVFWLDNASDSLTNYSAYVDKVEGLPGDAATHEVTVMGSSAEKLIAGLASGQFSISGPWDATVDAALNHALGRQKSFEYGPQGGASTKIKYSGEAFCTGYKIDSSVSDAVRFSATFRRHDSITRGTFA